MKHRLIPPVGSITPPQTEDLLSEAGRMILGILERIPEVRSAAWGKEISLGNDPHPKAAVTIMNGRDRDLTVTVRGPSLVQTIRVHTRDPDPVKQELVRQSTDLGFNVRVRNSSTT